MKRVIILALMIVFTRGICFAQTTFANKNHGLIRISMPSVRYEYVASQADEPNEDIFLRGLRLFIKIPYKGRTILKNKDGVAEFHIDNYEITVPTGFYRLVIKGVERYRLANFYVKPGGTNKFSIPRFRWAWTELCKEDQRIMRMYNSEESHAKQHRAYSRPPYKRLRTEVLILDKPFEIVVEHCGKQIKDEVLRYNSAHLYFKNYYIAADEITVDKKNRRLIATGSEASPILVQISGEEIGEKEKFTLDLRATGEWLNFN